ncbi:DinB family protein [Microbacteriaceae bacterium 4G12]
MGRVEEVFLSFTFSQFQHIKIRAEQALEQLTDEDLHWKLNEESNSIAVIVKHISGNMHSRWVDFLTVDGEKDYRNRDDEFVDSIKTRKELLQRWESGWRLLFSTLRELKPDDLLKTVTIRSKPLTVLEAIQIEIAHCSNHLGQILYIGKQIKGSEWRILSIPKK